LKNLTIAFPDVSHEERMRIARTSMHHLCYNFVEFLQLPFMNQKWLENEVIFHGIENYERARAKGKGVLIMSLHLGNGDVGLAALALKGFRLHVISKKFKNRFLNQLWFGVREKMGTRFMEPHGSSLPFEILKACRQNEAVVFVIDQFMGKPYGISSTFFGRKTGTAYGLALFAMKSKAPVLPVYTYRDAQFRTHVVFEEEIGAEKNEDKDLQIRQMTQKYNDRVEAIVRKHPDQWMWVHRRWKKWE
jgi:KDO2-lipid IV(A) lauroyltransferase